MQLHRVAIAPLLGHIIHTPPAPLYLITSRPIKHNSQSHQLSNHHARPANANNPPTSSRKGRTYTTTAPLRKQPRNPLPPRPTLPDSELKHVYLKGSGPGGQKINKTSSAVQLTHLPTGIVVKSQATRSQKQNHNIARRILAEKIEVLEKGPESRAAKKVEMLVKKKRGADKKKRRKYRRLAASAGEGEEEAAEDYGEVEEKDNPRDVVGGDQNEVAATKGGPELTNGIVLKPPSGRIGSESKL